MPSLVVYPIKTSKLEKAWLRKTPKGKREKAPSISRDVFDTKHSESYPFKVFRYTGKKHPTSWLHYPGSIK